MAQETGSRPGDLSDRLSNLKQLLAEQKKAEEEKTRLEGELRSKKALLELFFERAPEAILLADPEGRVLDVNAEFSRLFEFDRSEALGKRIDDLIIPRDRTEEASRITEETASGSNQVVESVRQKKGGALIDVSILAAPIVVNGRVESLLAIYRDITARRRMQEDIRREKLLLECLFDTVPDAIVLTDPSGQVQKANPSFLAMFGFDLDEVRGRSIDDLIVPPEEMEMAREITRLAGRGMNTDVKTVRRKKDGTPVDVRVLSAVINVDEATEGAFAIYRRIDEEEK